MSLYGQHTLARQNVPLNSIVLTGSGATYTRDAQGQFSISLPTAGTTYRLGIPLQIFPWRVDASGSTPNLFGLKLSAIALWYSIGAVDLTAHTFTINQESIQPNASRAAATTPGGTLTYDVDDGTGTSLPTTQRSNLYKTIVSLPTPIALVTDLAILTAEWTLATGASTGTAKVMGVQLRGTLGLYI